MPGFRTSRRRLFSRKARAEQVAGVGYSALVTVAPMIVVIGAIFVSEWFLNYSQVRYYDRGLLAGTQLYLFIFSLLAVAPFNAVISKYLADAIFEERFADILPCFYGGMVLNVAFGNLFAIPFCVHEYLVGQVPLYYVFTGFCGFNALVLVFYSMVFLTVTKDYLRITIFYAIGMAVMVGLALVLHALTNLSIPYVILLSMVTGFTVVATEEIALVQSYYRENSGNYKKFFRSFGTNWKLIPINFLYTLGLYIHNFVFWSTPQRTIYANSFLTHTAYDMASSLALFTNISVTVAFLAWVEMTFHKRYKAFSEAIIGGRARDIRIARDRMFRTMSEEVMSLFRVQFIITVIAFLFCIVMLPRVGLGGETLRMYNCLAAGYYILFPMYSEMLLLYYFEDLTGAMMTSASFCFGTFAGSIWSSGLPDIWAGMGLVIGALIAFTVAFFRLHWLENHIAEHTFCKGTIIERVGKEKPTGKVFQKQ